MLIVLSYSDHGLLEPDDQVAIQSSCVVLVVDVPGHSHSCSGIGECAASISYSTHFDVTIVDVGHEHKHGSALLSIQVALSWYV